MRRQMMTNTIRWIAFLLVLGFLFGCAEDRGIELIDPLEPPEENHPPVITSQSDTFTIVGDTLRLDFSATDQDGDSIRFEQEMPCTWEEIRTGQCHRPIAHIDSRTGRFWFYPRTYDIPTRRVTVSVNDRRGGYAVTIFSVSVSMGP